MRAIWFSVLLLERKKKRVEKRATKTSKLQVKERKEEKKSKIAPAGTIKKRKKQKN